MSVSGTSLSAAVRHFHLLCGTQAVMYPSDHGRFIRRPSSPKPFPAVPVDPPLPPAEAQFGQLLLKLAPEEAVDDKVETGVENNEQVADVVEAKVERTLALSRVFKKHVIKNLVESCRRFAHDEHEHDDNHH